MPKLSKDHEKVALKFDELIGKADDLCRKFEQKGDGTLPGDTYYEVRVSAINLLTRLTSENSIYAQEFKSMMPNAPAMKGLLKAARADYLQGFMTDHALLISADIFTDMLVQAEVLLEHDYKDAAAVIIRAVLEDALRRLCAVHEIEIERRIMLGKLNDKLYKQKVYTKLVHKEITAKAEVGNSAAHGRFDEYTKQDVVLFLEFVIRFLGQYLK